MSDELDEIQAIFFEECTEGLAAAEEGLSAMQNGDTSADTIASVFRAVHSIKGGAGAFGHTALTHFAHSFENVLDAVRGGKIEPTLPLVRVMLIAFDLLSDHVSAATGQAGVPEDGEMIARLEAILANGGLADDGEDATPAAQAPAPAAPATEAPAGEEDPFGFQPVTVAIEELDGESGGPADWTVRFTPGDADLANAGEPMLVIREVESLGGEIVAVDVGDLPALRDIDTEAAYFGWTLRVPGTVEESAIRDCFDFVSPEALVEITREEAGAIVADAVPEPAVEQEAALPDVRAQVDPSADLDQMLSMVQSIAEATTIAPSAPPAPEADKANKFADKPSEMVSQTIRVDLAKLDMLLNLVGELVIRNSILSDRLSSADAQRVELPELARLTRQIQDNVMSLRAQPIRQAFSRVPRMLRDLGAETGKTINLETIGETTEVDKGVIEKIGDPLTHMIRNAADHGIESAEERIAAGKSPDGTIRLSAEQKGARIFVRVKDDGRGINREKVLAKAVERGIVPADAQLSNEEIDQLICAPGFSTADTISNISGRGVGMDVVRSNVEALGGRVEIASVPGEGTTFTMILPLTLAILDGMIVRLAGQRFVLPLAHVIETVQPEKGQVKRTTPNTEVIEMRGEYLPVKRATEIFGLNDDRSIEDSLVVIVESETAGHVGLMVDTIDDRREVVIKSLDQNLHPIRGLGGATILGDGSIALILDIEALVASPTQTRFAPKGLAA
ncbi:chemotaxis protein CheA [Stakelama tenebrarum]|uniref:Chemotaxis protein CheA n=1 Tax=Stakelama tenebrarum TaxID=2711215 RepID=A0A6G6Y4E7_9SPHN|nr:chemotaxis protein CheA [Sphingosinithalassobacter tenebrarum]QIG79721.1 chemotaxis protein CheA [Sphingosinithalassobacter tenebrarum]